MLNTFPLVSICKCTRSMFQFGEKHICDYRKFDGAQKCFQHLRPIILLSSLFITIMFNVIVEKENFDVDWIGTK